MVYINVCLYGIGLLCIGETQTSTAAHRSAARARSSLQHSYKLITQYLLNDTLAFHSNDEYIFFVFCVWFNLSRTLSRCFSLSLSMRMTFILYNNFFLFLLCRRRLFLYTLYIVSMICVFSLLFPFN